MTRKEYRFPATDGSAALYGIAYAPDAPKGYVQFVHDTCEHIGRYDAILRQFCEAGYVAFGFSLPGHGASAQPGDRKPAALRSASALLEDIHTMFLLVLKDFEPEIRRQIVYAGPHGGSPHEVARPTLRCIVGMGFGSALAKLYAIRYPDCNALILCADRGYAGGVRRQLKLCAQELRRLPESAVSDRMDACMGASYDALFEGTAKNRWRLASTHALRRYQQDEENAVQYDLASWRTVLQAESAYRLRAWVVLLPKYMPVYFISGGDDAANGRTADLAPVLNMMKMKNRVNTFYKFYSGSRHDVLFDRKRDETLTDMIFFVNQVQKQMC